MHDRRLELHVPSLVIFRNGDRVRVIGEKDTETVDYVILRDGFVFLQMYDRWGPVNSEKVVKI